MNNVARFLVPPLLGVLLIQVSLLRPHLEIPVTSYGDTSVTELLTPRTISPTQESATFALYADQPSAVFFVGDVLLARHVETLLQQKGSDYPFAGLQFSSFARHPYVIGNFESAIPEKHVQTENGHLRFSVNHQYLAALYAVGFTHLSLANNHTYDYGEEGFHNTQAAIAIAGMTPVGKPIGLDNHSVTFLSLQGTQVAVIALHTLQSTISNAEFKMVIDYASARSSLQIVYIHWGDEYELTHNAAQRNLAEELVAMGVDLIIGHHPHVVQDIDLIDGVPVLYSLGNYIFDQYLSLETEQGLLVQLDVTDEPRLYLMPVTSIRTPSQPTLMTARESSVFLSKLAERSAPQLQAFITVGSIPLHSTVATSPKIAMITQ